MANGEGGDVATGVAAGGVDTALAVPVATEGVPGAAATVGVLGTDVGDAAVGVGELLPPPHAMRVTTAAMTIDTRQMRCVRVMTRDSPFQVVDSHVRGPGLASAV
jgi:hypothetical protein